MSAQPAPAPVAKRSDQIGDLLAERRVDGADDVEEGAAPFDEAAQRALKNAQPRREIKTRRGQRDLCRAPQLRSRFSRGARRAKERNRRSTGAGRTSTPRR
jgi:hypothetical protein